MTAVQPVNVPQPVKLKIEDFELLDRSGAFDGYAKTELIEGAIYAMQGQYRPHSFAKNELTYRLRRRLEEIGSDLLPQSEATVEMGSLSAPQPDIVLTTEALGERYVPLASVALVVEVSDSLIAFDLKEKAPLYARHAIREYWVLDISAGALYQLWSPSPDGYEESRSVAVGERVVSITVPGLEIDSSGLIEPRSRT